MDFAELVDKTVAYKKGYVASRLLGTLLDLFGSCTVEEMTPLFIEKKFEGAVRSWTGESAGPLSRAAISYYRSTLRKIFECAAEMGEVSSNPVLSGQKRDIRKAVVRAWSIDLLKRLEAGENRVELLREAVSLVERTEPELAKAVRTLSKLGEFKNRGPRKPETQSAWKLAVSFVAKQPEEKKTGTIARHCGAEYHEVKKWLDSPEFHKAVQIERGEILTEAQIRVVNSGKRRSLAKRSFTETERETVSRRYPYEPTSAIAADLGRPTASIWKLAQQLRHPQNGGDKERTIEAKLEKTSKAAWQKNEGTSARKVRALP